MPCPNLQSRAALSAAGEMSMNKHSRHQWIVDVIEDGSASIEVDGRTVTPIPQWLLPEGAKEGDVLAVTHDRERGKSVLLIETALQYGPNPGWPPAQRWVGIATVVVMSAVVVALALVPFRNEIESGPGGSQIQIEDPDGNPIELHQPPAEQRG